MPLRTAATVSRISLIVGLALGAAIHAAPALATILDFEGLNADCNSTTAASNGVPNGYGGLNWSSISGTFGTTAVGLECDANYQGPSYNNTYGAPSPDYAAFNGQQYGEVRITAVSGTFDFSGGEFSSFVSNDGTLGYEPYSSYSVRLEGYQGAVLAFSAELDLYADNGVSITPAQYYALLVGWTGLDRLSIFAGNGVIANSPTFGNDGRAFLMDNLNVTLNAVPEPGTALLLLAGLVALARNPKRRRA